MSWNKLVTHLRQLRLQEQRRNRDYTEQAMHVLNRMKRWINNTDASDQWKQAAAARADSLYTTYMQRDPGQV